MALPPPNYDDALKYPVTSGSCSDVIRGADDAAAAADRRLPVPGSHSTVGDILPSYDTACRFHTASPTSPSSSSPRRSLHSPRHSSVSGTGSVVSQIPRIPLSPSSSSQLRDRDVTGRDSAHASPVHGVTIRVTEMEPEPGGAHMSMSSMGGGGGGAEPLLGENRRANQCSGRTSGSSAATDDRNSVAGTCGSSSVSHLQHSSSSSSASHGEGPSGRGRAASQSSAGLVPRSPTGSGRRPSENSHKLCVAVQGQRSQRSCSDAGIHEVSRTRAAAAAASASAAGAGPRRSSSLWPGPSHGAAGSGRCQHHHCHHHHHHYHHQHQHHQQPRSHSCIPVHQLGSDSNVHNGHTGGRRSHSHSSISRLAATARGGGGQESLCGHPTTSSRRPSSEGEEEVTYVWKDNRVQVHHARTGLTTPDLSVSTGQHVQYIWRHGNVQRVVRGSNHEVLSAEVVPPREIKGINYCTVFGVMAFFVFAIVTLIFVFKVFY